MIKHSNATTIGKIIPFIQDGEYYFKRGLKAYRSRDLYKAKKYLERAVDLDNQEPVFLCQLATVLADLGEYKESIQLLEETIKLEPEMNECYYFIANNYAHLGLFSEAKKHAMTYLEHSPDGEFYEETEELLDLLNIESDDLNFYDDFLDDELIVKQENAKELLESGQLKEAIKLLESLTKDYPEFWSAYNNLALAYFYSGFTTKALKVLDTVLEKNPGNLHAVCNLAIINYYLGKSEEVQEHVKSLKAVHPIDLDHRYKLGVTFSIIGEYKAGLTWLRWLHKHGYDGDNAFYYWLAVSAYHNSHHSLAKEAWQEVVEQNPAKEGKEPWKQEHKEQESIINVLNKTDQEETKLLAVFLMKELKEDKAFEALEKFLAENAETTLLQEFTKVMLSKLKGEPLNVSNEIENGISVMEHLYVNTKPLEEYQSLYLFWFYLLKKLLKQEQSLKNTLGWAAATEYIWQKELNYALTQTDVAEKYEVSVSTLRKYVKVVQNITE